MINFRRKVNWISFALDTLTSGDRILTASQLRLPTPLVPPSSVLSPPEAARRPEDEGKGGRVCTVCPCSLAPPLELGVEMEASIAIKQCSQKQGE